MIKTYQSEGRMGLSISVSHKGKIYRVSFTGGSLIGDVQYDGTFTTPDENIQKAIEKSVDYQLGRITCILGKENNDDVEVPKIKHILKITTGQAAISKLIELGFDPDLIGNSIDEVVSFSKTNNIDFPDWVTFNKK